MILQTKEYISVEDSMTDLQSKGLRLENFQAGASGRKGGAGPSDHKALMVEGKTIMVPVFNEMSESSPFYATEPNELGVSILYYENRKIGPVTFPKQPEFYKYSSSDGIPFWKIAQLHSHNVLATTILQNCIRYHNRETSCQFCAIGESLKAGKTIAYKKPHHLAEVARVAKELDGVEQFVMTTGTPASNDRGAKILFESVEAVKQEVDIPIQVQCEPPDDFVWFEKLKEAGADSIGMHLEAVSEPVRKEIMPGKAEVSVDFYFQAFEAAVRVFGKGNVSTYILAGLGDTQDDIISVSRKLVETGVYPFVVPFVPIVGTPLQHRKSPSPDFMEPILKEVGAMLAEADMFSENLKAGCAKCGACSTLKNYEKKEVA